MMQMILWIKLWMFLFIGFQRFLVTVKLQLARIALPVVATEIKKPREV